MAGGAWLCEPHFDSHFLKRFSILIPGYQYRVVTGLALVIPAPVAWYLPSWYTTSWHSRRQIGLHDLPFTFSRVVRGPLELIQHPPLHHTWLAHLPADRALGVGPLMFRLVPGLGASQASTLWSQDAQGVWTCRCVLLQYAMSSTRMSRKKQFIVLEPTTPKQETTCKQNKTKQSKAKQSQPVSLRI